MIAQKYRNAVIKVSTVLSETLDLKGCIFSIWIGFWVSNRIHTLS